MDRPEEGPVRVVAFDVDGTLVDGHTQEMLAKYLARRRHLAAPALLVTVFWFLLYRLGLDIDILAIRRKFIRRFAGMSVETIDALGDDFVARIVAPRVRGAALKEIEKLRREGGRVLLVSGSIEPIVARLAALVGADGWVATKLVVRDGRLTGEIDGEDVYGDAKFSELAKHADGMYGDWTLGTAYGDHESDEALLASAEKAVVVCPAAGFRARALERGWTVVDWS